MKHYVRIFLLASLLVLAFSLAVVKGETCGHAHSALRREAVAAKMANFSFAPEVYVQRSLARVELLRSRNPLLLAKPQSNVVFEALSNEPAWPRFSVRVF